MKATKLFGEFFNSEKSSGVLLILSAVASLLLANDFVGENYILFWHREASFAVGAVRLDLTIENWINEGLMTVFFLLVGLEIKRELVGGELSGIKKASLPVLAAIGGMVVPALIHFAFNAGTGTERGFGIPMATDIAFALGILSLGGKRVPMALKVFLAALAIIDDLGAILVIAVFYSHGLQLTWLMIAVGIFVLLLGLNRLRVYQLAWYVAGGIIMWYCMLQSGVHPTVTGVLVAFAVPMGSLQRSPAQRLQHLLHKPVAFIIVPLFAFANTAIILSGSFDQLFLQTNSLGIIAGLLLGKPLGILLLCFIAIKLKWAKLPSGVNWFHLTGAGVLAGIGFTMSVFIALLAFEDPAVVLHSKIAILVASSAAGMIGFLLVKKSTIASREG